MRALVIGADGFVGRWLVRHLADAGDEVHGLVGRRFQPPLPSASSVAAVDVRDAAAVRAEIRGFGPEAVYYLAGVSQPTERENLDLALDISVTGALTALSACAALDAPARLLLVGSSHMYADPASDAPIAEDSPLGSRTVYGASKAAAEAAALAIADSAGVEVIATRPFNHIGPGQSTAFVVPALADQVARITARLSEPEVRAGSLRARRDFTDVRDVVRAYRLLVEQGAPGTAYNIGSGHAVSIREVLDRLLRLGNVKATVSTDEKLLRPSEPPAMVADASRLKAATGWEPSISLDESLRDVLNDALERIGRPAIAGAV
jgi:GDP-4-dehydro-6-deoxy-D-mannose reductase